MVTTLHVVRHGETDWNRGGRVQGHTDIPLNDEGRRQARALAADLASIAFDAVYASDLSRAAETATILVGSRSLVVSSCVALREKHFGTWEGLTDTEVLERFPRALNGAWGDGETADELSDRVIAALVRIAAAHPGGQVLVVTHGGPIRALFRWAGREPSRIANCSVSTFAYDGDRLEPANV
jgi:broad specificity phosphatase PhoE